MLMSVLENFLKALLLVYREWNISKVGINSLSTDSTSNQRLINSGGMSSGAALTDRNRTQAANGSHVQHFKYLVALLSKKNR